jgi:hypothetical protein
MVGNRLGAKVGARVFKVVRMLAVCTVAFTANVTLEMKLEDIIVSETKITKSLLLVKVVVDNDNVRSNPVVQVYKVNKFLLLRRREAEEEEEVTSKDLMAEADTIKLFAMVAFKLVLSVDVGVAAVEVSSKLTSTVKVSEVVGVSDGRDVGLSVGA